MVMIIEILCKFIRRQKKKISKTLFSKKRREEESEIEMTTLITTSFSVHSPERLFFSSSRSQTFVIYMCLTFNTLNIKLLLYQVRQIENGNHLNVI